MRATLENAQILARQMEQIAAPLGYHVALGGGCVHQDGERKDIDIVLYRRRVNRFENTCKSLVELFRAWEAEMPGYFRAHPDYDLEKNTWCMKALWHGTNVDVLYPESDATESGYIRQANDTNDFKDVVLT